MVGADGEGVGSWPSDAGVDDLADDRGQESPVPGSVKDTVKTVRSPPRGSGIGSSNARSYPRTGPLSFLAFGLKEMLSRNAIFLIDSGFRPVASAASSNDFEPCAISIKRRCSANDQLDFRTMPRNALCDPGQSRQAEYIRLATSPSWVRTWGNCPVRNR